MSFPTAGSFSRRRFVAAGIVYPDRSTPGRCHTTDLGTNRCFAIASGAAIDSGPPTAYSVTPASQFYAEAVEVYAAVNEATLERKASGR